MSARRSGAAAVPAESSEEGASWRYSRGSKTQVQRSPIDSLRKGKWTPEEENYANKIIFLFNQGLLSVEPGTTLRSHLSDKLNCDPMRITKKFAGASCIGKQVYQPCDDVDERELRQAEEELARLEVDYVNRLHGRVVPRNRTSDRNSFGTRSSSNYNDEYDGDDYYAEEADDMVLDGGGIRARHDPGPRGRGAAGLPGGAIRSSSLRHGSSGLIRRVVSAPNLQAYGLDEDHYAPPYPRGSHGVTAPKSTIKRSQSAMQIDDFEQFVANEAEDSAAAMLLIQIMGKKVDSSSWKVSPPGGSSTRGARVKEEKNVSISSGSAQEQAMSASSETESVLFESVPAQAGYSSQNERKYSMDSPSPVGLAIDDDSNFEGSKKDNESSSNVLGVFGSISLNGV